MIAEFWLPIIKTYTMKKTLLLILITPILYGQNGWQHLSTSFIESFNCTHITPNGTVFIGSDLGNIYYSNTGGNTWDTAVTNAQDGIADITFISANQAWAVGDDGLILQSTNGGLNWTTIPSGVTANLESIFFADTATAYIAGRNGTILKSINGGSSWSVQTSGTTDRLESVWFLTPNRGFVAGRDGVFLETSNGGSTWTSAASLGSDDNKDIYFLDATTGFVAGENGIFKTTNAGNSWSPTTVVGISEISAIHFANATNGYVVGEMGEMGKTVDGGNNWNVDTVISAISFVELNDVHFLNAQAGFAVGDGGTLLRYLGSPSTSFCLASYWVDTTHSGGNHVYIVNNSSPAVNNPNYSTTYFWDFGDGNTSTQRLPVHTYANTGAYAVCLTIVTTDTNSNVCSHTFCDTVGLDSLGNLIYKNTQAGFTLNVVDSNSIGIADYRLSEDAIYPNPAKDKIYLNLPEEWTNNEIRLIDTRGRIVKRKSYQTDMTWNLDGIKPGLYLIQIMDKQKNWHYGRLVID